MYKVGFYREEANMAQQLGMDKATYARNEKGAAALLKSKIHDIDEIIRMLKPKSDNKNYMQVVNAVQKYWSGEDADKFLEKFTAALESISSTFATKSEIIKAALEADAKSFAANQSEIAANMK